ncbi:MAG: sensor domain-containing diguanylate cyclase [Endomicrobiales bacterium]
MNPIQDSHHWPARDIISSIVVPVVSFVLFFVWVYELIQGRPSKILIFPSISTVILLLYFFSGQVHAGILLCFVSVVSFLGLFIPPYEPTRLLFIFEAGGLWLLFFCIDHYRTKAQLERDRFAGQLEILETKIAFYENKVLEDRRACDDLNQRIFNFQMLGRMIEVFGVTLKEEKIIPLISELAAKLIRRGNWKVKKGSQNDFFAQYVKNQGIPLIIQNITFDPRFTVKSPRYSSLIALPLEVDGRFWGILKGTAHQSNAFNEADLRILSLLGGIASLVLSNCHLYQKTQDLAITDGLTGLFVQRYFRERLKGEIVRSRNSSMSLSVAIIDVDNFKLFNDAHGHAGGDVILRHIAILLRRRLRETDILSRYGGEEFAVIMVQTDLAEALKIIEELCRSVQDERFFLPTESFKPICVNATVSAGIASLSALNVTDEDIIKSADKALYRAKSNGRNRVEVGE